ncbi:alpha/beta hydrolase [Methanoculleus sp. Wushi-C6]|uniref:Alpha/beta hydrolase n=1 Tax=Methanoculleus caldifontis TaxID=2651577 RepID=A0ABU3X1H0_9EURY|nr:alpha/beta hydrolase [Methanoculleus sp. Wushi-C6]MDV2481903.1 alpha/beta hydrolase [Methanoculleus sp. Wushi-C6]
MAQKMATTAAPGRYAPVNGLSMYYETHGAGRPLVLLHGAFMTIEGSFQRMLPTLAGARQVIAVEQQAHGRTGDIDRPLTYEGMAADTVELLRQLGIRDADFFGYSMGAAIALDIAVRHPGLVHKLVLASPSYTREGAYAEMYEGEENLKAEDLADTPFVEEYARTAPNPGDWPVLVEKVKQLDREFRGWTADEVRSIRAPVLAIIGDSDVVLPEHAVEIFRLLGGGVPGDLVGLPVSRLAVLPGTTHITLIDRTDWLLEMIGEFLDAPAPEAGRG